MKVGSIHKNSKTRYFAVGGYFSYEEDRIKIKAKYKKENLKLKKEKNLDLDTEIKSYDMTEEEKIKIFNKIQDIETFNGCVKVFDKRYMIKETEFCIYDDDFKITYYDSKTNYGI